MLGIMWMIIFKWLMVLEIIDNWTALVFLFVFHSHAAFRKHRKDLQVIRSWTKCYTIHINYTETTFLYVCPDLTLGFVFPMQSMAEVLAKKEELADRLEKANEEAIASAIAEEEQLTREIEAEENNDINIETDNDSDFSVSVGFILK